MDIDFNEPFEIELIEDEDLERPHFYIYDGLLDSNLFNMNEVMLIIHLIASADNCSPDQINTSAVSINKLSRKSGMSRGTICKYIKSLIEKGVLIKKNRASEGNGCLSNTYEILNYNSVWDCETLEELKKVTDKIKSGISANDLQDSAG